MGILTWLETNPLSIWVYESPSVWAQPTVLTLHAMGMIVLVGASWMLDMRLLGIIPNAPLSAFRWVFPALRIGLIVNVATGMMLFSLRASTWATALPFLVKMGLVVASVALVFPIRKHVMSSDADTREIGSNLRLLACASMVAWTGAVTAGRLLAYLVP